MNETTKEVIEDFKNMIKGNKAELIAISVLIPCMAFGILFSWLTTKNPKTISPHDSEEVCHDLGGDYIKYGSAVAGSVVAPIYKCMRPIEEDGEPRKEIDEGGR